MEEMLVVILLAAPVPRRTGDDIGVIQHLFLDVMVIVLLVVSVLMLAIPLPYLSPFNTLRILLKEEIVLGMTIALSSLGILIDTVTILLKLLDPKHTVKFLELIPLVGIWTKLTLLMPVISHNVLKDTTSGTLTLQVYINDAWVSCPPAGGDVQVDVGILYV